MRSNKIAFVFFAVIGMLMYQSFLVQRDQKMFNAYDKVCAELPKPHPDCRYAK